MREREREIDREREGGRDGRGEIDSFSDVLRRRRPRRPRRSGREGGRKGVKNWRVVTRKERYNTMGDPEVSKRKTLRQTEAGTERQKAEGRQKTMDRDFQND